MDIKIQYEYVIEHMMWRVVVSVVAGPAMIIREFLDKGDDPKRLLEQVSESVNLVKEKYGRWLAGERDEITMPQLNGK